MLYLDSDAPGEPITLYINSPGGCVNSEIAVYEAIRSIKSPVTTVCAGLCASMGSLLFLAGEDRTMLPHTELMMHDPSFGDPGRAGEKPLAIREKLEMLMKTREIIAKIISERTGQPLDKVYEVTKNDTYFSAEEAVEWGAATAIGTFAPGQPNSL